MSILESPRSKRSNRSNEAPPPNATQLRAFGGEPNDLFAQTLRTVAILVGACVLFVGSLSTAAFFIASKAMGPSAHESSSSPATESAPAAPKKPLSI